MRFAVGESVEWILADGSTAWGEVLEVRPKSYGQMILVRGKGYKDQVWPEDSPCDFWTGSENVQLRAVPKRRPRLVDMGTHRALRYEDGTPFDWNDNVN